MNQSRYLEFEPESLILRDHLAIERTAMANERTLLAYVRTMIGLIAVGGTLLKLFDELFMIVTGWFIISLGLLFLFIGFIRYARIEVVLSQLCHQDNFRDNGDWMHSLLWAVVRKLQLVTIKIEHK